MIWRHLPTACFILSLALFGAAGYAYFFVDDTPDAPGAFVPDPDREFPALAVGKNEITFRLHNPTGHAVRVIGYQFC